MCDHTYPSARALPPRNLSSRAGDASPRALAVDEVIRLDCPARCSSTGGLPVLPPYRTIRSAGAVPCSDSPHCHPAHRRRVVGACRDSGGIRDSEGDHHVLDV